MKLPTFLMLATALVSGPAFADAVFTAKLTKSQLQIKRDERGFSQCGVRVVFMDERLGSSDFYDLSVIIVPDLFTGVMSVGKRVRSDAMLKQNVSLANLPLTPPVKTWIVKSTQSKPVIPDKTATHHGQLLGSIGADKAYETIIWISSGEQMQLLAEFPNEPERIISFTSPLDTQDKRTLDECLNTAPDRMQAKANEMAEDKKK